MRTRGKEWGQLFVDYMKSHGKEEWDEKAITIGCGVRAVDEC